MGDFIETAKVLLISVVVGIAVIFGIAYALYLIEDGDNPMNYSYIDLDGNTGYANWCFNGVRLTCNSDGRTFEVKEYRKND